MKIIQFLTDSPGMTQVELAKELGVSSPTMGWILGRMNMNGLVRCENRQSSIKRWYIEEMELA